MRYIDSGSRDSSHALGAWLQSVLTASIVEVRWQSGFFSAESLGFLAATLQRLAKSDLPFAGIIGSNEPGTLHADVRKLVALLGLPRTNARLGVVKYGNAFYHPKTYHFRRDDGSQCGYVGSANLTPKGLSVHVEAGLVLDTQQGDSSAVLDEIAAAVDAWFATKRDGLRQIRNLSDVDSLVAAGVLLEAPPEFPPAPTTQPGVVSPPLLDSLVELPPLPPSPGAEIQSEANPAAPVTHPVEAPASIEVAMRMAADSSQLSAIEAGKLVLEQQAKLSKTEFEKWLMEYVGFHLSPGKSDRIDLVAEKDGERRAIQITSLRLGPRTSQGVLIDPEVRSQLEATAQQLGLIAYFARIFILPHESAIKLVIIPSTEIPRVLRRVQHNWREDIKKIRKQPPVEYWQWRA